MTDEELNLALAEALTVNTTASEENMAITSEVSEAVVSEVPEVPEVPDAPEANISAALVTIEPPGSASAIEVATDESRHVLQKVESEIAQPDPSDFDIIEEPVQNVGFVKRWTRKIVGWVKRVFSWGKKKT